jgi:hypothetical protein
MWANVHDMSVSFIGMVKHGGANPNELPSKVLYRLYSDPATGGLWVGSEGGVYSL